MATRPQFNPYVVIPNARALPANSSLMTGNIISAPTIVQKLSMISYQAVWAGTAPVGTISIELSNNYALNVDGSVQNAGTWTTMTFLYNGSPVTSVPVSGNSGDGMIDIDATGAYAIRLIYTFTSGTGNLTVTIAAKVS